MQLQVLLGIGVYIVAMVVIGVYASKKIATSVDFINAGRSLGLLLCSATLFASWFGGGTALGGAGAAYEEGFLGVIADPFGAGLVMIIAGMFVLRPIRKLGFSTIVSFYEVRYNKLVGVLASIFEIITYIGWAGALIVSFGFITHALTGIPETYSILIGGIVIIAYTWAGGMWAVTLTDAVQMVVLIIGVVFMLPLGIKAVGGWDAFTSQVPENFFHMWPRGANLNGWLVYVAAWLSLGLGCLPEQALIQRGTAAKNENVAVWSGYNAGILYLTIGLIPPILGMIGSLLFPGLDNTEMVLPKMALEVLSPWGVTLFLGALIAAIMSSADSAILAPAVIMGDNVLRYFKPDASDEEVLKVSRIMVPIFTVVCIAVAMYAKVVYDLMVLAYTLLLVSLVVPLIGGLYWRKANSWGAAASIITGGVVFAVLSAFPSEVWPAEIVALLANLVVYFVVSLATQAQDKPKDLFVDENGDLIPLKDNLGFISPFKKEEVEHLR
jgi:SSS family transporter